MSMKTEDVKIVERVRGGEMDAFAILMAKYRSRIYRLAFGIMKNHADAEDVMQETFIQAFRSLDRFRGDSAFYTWLYRIGLNTSLNSRLKQRRASEHVELSFDDGADLEEGWTGQLLSETPPAQLERKEVLQAVDQFLCLMPEQFAEALILQALDGRTCAEISGLSRVSVNTVRSRIFRAREFLFDRLPECRPQRRLEADREII